MSIPCKTIPLAIMAVAGLLAAPLQVTLSVGGKAAAEIVIADQAGATARAAAEDLRSYLDRITGATFSLRRESGASRGATQIHVGATRAAAAAGLRPASLKAEGYAIRTAPNRLFIVGAGTNAHDDGTLFGVADFLDRDLGVRWLWPGELGIIVPNRPTVTVGPIERTISPAMAIRRVRDGISNMNPDKLLRGMQALRMDPARHARMVEDSQVWTSHQRIGSSVQASYGHAFGSWWERFSADRPDYFAMMPDGKRGLPFGNPGRVKICVSNAAVAEEWMRGAREYFKANPDSVAVSASPNDNAYQGHCTCAECERWDAPEAEKYPMDWKADGQVVRRPHVSLSDRYFHFYNLVADKLAREFPGKMVGAYAYGAWKTPPVRERDVRSNIMVGYVGFGDMYVSDMGRTGDLSEWDGWAKIAKNLFYRPNLLHAGHGMPLVYIHKLARDMRHRAETGMMGCDFDSLVHHWSTQGLNYYVLAKLLWDPRADVDTILDDYARNAFGPAASAMKAYYLSVEARTDWMARRFEADKSERERFVRTLPDFYPLTVIDEWRAQLDTALRQVAPDSMYARRIRWMKQGLDYAAMTTEVLDLSRRQPRDVEHKKRVAAAGLSRERWYRDHLYDWAVFPPLLRWRESANVFGNRENAQ